MDFRCAATDFIDRHLEIMLWFSGTSIVDKSIVCTALALL